jgi:drug/metabolite transporter (DMT)-like permease
VSPFALVLLLLAAGLHAAWNFVLKSTQDKLAVFWWAVVLSSLACVPALLWSGPPARAAWPLIAVSAAAQAGYLALLSWAYSVGDFSLIYPVARGSAPLFVLSWSFLWLQERPTMLGGTGILTLAFGLMWLGATGLSGGKSNNKLALVLALVVALTISVYTVIDGAGVRLTSPLSYFLAEWCLSAVLLLPAMLWAYGWPRLQRVGREQPARIFVIAFGSAGAYMLALQAYALAPVSYAGAIREVSVVFASWLGWRYGSEKLGGQRVAASLAVFAGIVLIALG